MFTDKKTSEKYINNGLYGANIFKERVDVEEIFLISYPVYDPDRQIMIVYIERDCGSLCGQGVFHVFWVADDGIITPIGMYMAFMS